LCSPRRKVEGVAAQLVAGIPVYSVSKHALYFVLSDPND
jgi:hypothetical protein